MRRIVGRLFGTATPNSTRAAVSIIFATAVIPLSMTVGLAVDYSFYAEAQAQLNLAADAAAIHAVRIASQDFINGQSYSAAGVDGAAAGQQWFAAQAGVLPDGAVNTVTIPPVSYDAGTSTFNATVSYSGKIDTHFGGLFHIATWNIGGTASAVITTNSYVEISLLIDNSSSMLIGADVPDIRRLEWLTTCPPQSFTSTSNGSHGGWVTTGPKNAEYSWVYGGSLAYLLPNGKPSSTPPTLSAPVSTQGSCDTRYDGDATDCLYPPSFPALPPSSALDANGFCPANTGTPFATVFGSNYTPVVIDPATKAPANYPSAPCAFACHSVSGQAVDIYSLLQQARAAGASITLRLDVIQNAENQILQTLQNQQQVANEFAVGLYTFNQTLQQVYPSTGAEADTNLPLAQQQLSSIVTPAVADDPNTNFPAAMSSLYTYASAAGDGSSPNKRRKNLIIITDGLADYNSASGRIIGQMTDPLNETTCAPFKKLGYTIYVLYTTYYPLPNDFYLNNAKTAVEQPATNTASVAAGLQACATAPQDYYQATSSTQITTALNTILASALAAPGRISK